MGVTNMNAMKHTWTPSERKFLRVLKSAYEMTWEQAAPIFNTAFQIPNAFYPPALSAQHSELSRRASRDLSRDFQALFSTNADEEWEIKSHIANTAARLGMQIFERVPHYQIHQMPLTPSEPMTPTSSQADGQSEMMDVATQQKHLRTPGTPSKLTLHASTRSFCINPSQIDANRGQSSSRRTRTIAFMNEQDQGPPTSRLKRHRVKESPPSSELPRLLYRGYSDKSFGLNSAHGFRAGQFICDARIPPCPPLQEVRKEATRHVEGDKTPRGTFFISMTSNLVRALVIGARTMKYNSYVALIDTEKMTRQGDSIFCAKDLDLHPTKVKSYYPSGEYLCYGQIRQEAIVAHIAAGDILNSPPRTPWDVDPLGFEISLLDIAVQSLISSWNFKIKKNEPWRINEAFVSGVKHGLEGRDSDNLEDETSLIDLTVDHNDHDSLISELEIAAVYVDIQDETDETAEEETSLLPTTKQLSSASNVHNRVQEDVLETYEYPCWTGI
ncbi:uncharacterized protein KY384_001945 [Bacidia gigantensis]|uniref:uncharacterized protein n=1 Tax=Bacidia gigantensis TaxID=2732470 RepID=UPI001D059593|nr:uncharacterized protein KY384_001945 [Bacidia gigantensis]KAG8533162.1 hypothetical protein KY384_001945 [Bacidia gigantensis]